MKGIILAGGSGTRLHPITKGICKQLIPIYNKPMIYYPLSVLMLAGIREILIISTPEAVPQFKNLLGDGKNYGIEIKYKEQMYPKGIAEAFIIGEKFINNDSVCLILGDNIFYGEGLSNKLKYAVDQNNGATVFGYYVNDPSRYGVMDFDNEKTVVSIKEKPVEPKSNWAVTGLYFYNNRVVDYAKSLKPSSRGELEITDLNNIYLNNRELDVVLLWRGYAWLDTGTYNSLLDASMFIKTIEDRQGLKIGCIEEVAFKMGFITAEQVFAMAEKFKTEYGSYLKKIIQQN